MKNLFEFAPKELTQDGFICWLLSNWDEPELQDVAADFAYFLTDGKVDIRRHDFAYLKTHQQVTHMDVLCDFFFDEGGENLTKYLLVIEDKTTSSQHDNQLSRYNETLAKWAGMDVKDTEKLKGCNGLVRVYYKTTPLQEWEILAAKNADWKVFELKEIAEFWAAYTSHPNLIVKFYAEHICGIYKSSTADYRPTDNDVIAWMSFYENVLIPAFKKEFGDKINIWSNANRFGYAYFCFDLIENDKTIPYFEIRSRDNLGNECVARILKYYRDIEMPQINRYRDLIASSQDRIYKVNWGDKRTQQLGIASIALQSGDKEEFINAAIKAAKEYIEITTKWLAEK